MAIRRGGYDPSGLSLVAPFVGGGDILAQLHGIGAKLRSVDTFEIDDEKNRKFLTQLMRYYPDIYYNNLFKTYGDVANMDDWKEIKQNRGTINISYATPSCVTNTSVNVKKPAFEYTMEEIESMPIAALKSIMRQQGLSGETFDAMLDGLKIIEPEKSITEHGNISSNVKKRAYERLLQDTYGTNEPIMFRFDAGKISPQQRPRDFAFNQAVNEAQIRRILGLMDAYSKSDLWVSPEDLFKYANEEDTRTHKDIADKRNAYPRDTNEYGSKRILSALRRTTTAENPDTHNFIRGYISKTDTMPGAFYKNPNGALIVREEDGGIRFHSANDPAYEAALKKRKFYNDSAFKKETLSPDLPLNEPLSIRAMTVPEMALANGKDPKDYENESRAVVTRNIGDATNSRVSKLLLNETLFPGKIKSINDIHKLWTGGYV